MTKSGETSIAIILDNIFRLYSYIGYYVYMTDWDLVHETVCDTGPEMGVRTKVGVLMIYLQYSMNPVMK